MKPITALLIAALAATAAGGAAAQLLRPSMELRLGTGRASTEPRAADFIVAIVNSEPITNNEVRQAMVRLERELSQRGGVVPPRDELSRAVLERLINERVQLQHAASTGIRIDEAAVTQAVEGVARQNGLSMDQLRRRLEADGLTEARLRADLRNELTLNRVRERDVQPQVRVSELEVDQFIRERRDTDDLSSVELNIGHILIAVPESASQAQIDALAARAQRAYQRAAAGEDFAALAREYSEGAERDLGGVMGLRPADRFPQLFIDTVAKLPAGAVAQPVRSGAGYHVLKLLEKKQAGLPGMNVTQTRVRHILIRTSPQTSEAAAAARIAELRQRIAGGADFAALAREFGQDATSSAGGDLGWTNPGVFVPEFEDAMNTLAPGQLSQPVTTRFGVHLIQVMERRQTTLSEREQREIARNMLRDRKLEEVYERWVQDLRGRAFVQLREPPQ